MDDGIRALRQAGTATVTLAVPVAPASTLDELAREVDDVVYLATPEPFIAVGEHYRDFTQTSNEDVIAILQAARNTPR